MKICRDRPGARQAGPEIRHIVRAGRQIDLLEGQPVIAHQRLGRFAITAIRPGEDFYEHSLSISIR
jgi:hypothetical protein